MKNELFFFNLAVRETDFPQFNNVEERAAALMGGGIWRAVHAAHAREERRDEFICAALCFVHWFNDSVACKKEELYNAEDHNTQKICAVLDEWAADALQVNPVLLAKLAMKGWDERLKVVMKDWDERLKVVMKDWDERLKVVMKDWDERLKEMKEEL